jgi:hypothetical protein
MFATTKSRAVTPGERLSELRWQDKVFVSQGSCRFMHCVLVQLPRQVMSVECTGFRRGDVSKYPAECPEIPQKPAGAKPALPFLARSAQFESATPAPNASVVFRAFERGAMFQIAT